MSEISSDASTATPVPVQPLEYRGARDADWPIELTTSRQVWLGIGLFVAYLLWSCRQMFLGRVMIIGLSRGYYDFRDGAFRLIDLLPLLAATLYVMRLKEWRRSTAAILLVAGWVVACSESPFRAYTIVGRFWFMIPPIGSAIYLLAIRRYRGVAAGLFIAMGLMLLLGVGLIVVVVSMIGR